MVAGSVVFSLCCFLSYSFTVAKKDAFHEDLLLKPLPTGHVYAHFQFTTVWNIIIIIVIIIIIIIIIDSIYTVQEQCYQRGALFKLIDNNTEYTLKY